MRDGSIKNYPWPLIAWPVEKEAIAKLKDLRREWQKRNTFAYNILRKRLEKRGGTQKRFPLSVETALALYLPKKTRGRTAGYSPLETKQSWAIAVLIKYCGVKPVEILSKLKRDTSSDNRAPFRWLARRRARGNKILDAASRQETNTLKQWIASQAPRKLKAALLKTVHENPA